MGWIMKKALPKNIIPTYGLLSRAGKNNNRISSDGRPKNVSGVKTFLLISN